MKKYMVTVEYFDTQKEGNTEQEKTFSYAKRETLIKNLKKFISLDNVESCIAVELSEALEDDEELHALINAEFATTI